MIENGKIPMPEKKLYIKYGVIGIISIFFIAMLFTVFRSLRRSEVKNNSLLIEAKDETIKALKGERQAYQMVIDEKEKNIISLLKRDSVLNSNYIKSQQSYIKLNEQLRNIPDYIDRISGNDDSIRLAFARHGNDTP